MNKSAIASIVLIAVMCGFLLPMQVKAFQTPSGSNPTAYNYFGPRANTLVMQFFSSDDAEFSALQTGTIDFMDSILTPTQYGLISSNPSITTGFVAATELVEYDLNNGVAPFNGTAGTLYREALESMINRTNYLNTYFAGGGTPCYDPLDFNPFGAAAEAYCASLYPTNFATAYELFVQTGYPEYMENGTNGLPNYDTSGPGGTGFFTWFFASPFPTANSGTPAGGGGTPYAVAIPNATLQIFCRTEHNERLKQGEYLIDLANGPSSTFTQWAEAEYALPGHGIFTGIYALPVINGVVCYPTLNIVEKDVTSEIADTIVMTYYRYMIYTGAWILDEFQDGLEIWLSAETPQQLGWGAFALNYDEWVDTNYFANVSLPEYDYYVYQSLSASYPGYGHPNDPTGSEFWAIKAQDDWANEVPMIPMFYYSGQSAVLTRDNYTINAIGTGFDNWFTYMDSPGSGGVNPTLTWGWSADLENPNPISSTWAWDWYMMGPIYDSMLGANPYTETIIPALATNYAVTISDPANPFGPADSSALMTLRSDSYWQDVPAMSRIAYTLDHGTELNGPFADKQVTPADVAFTYEYLTHDGQYQPVHLFSTVYDVGQVVISSIYKPLFTADNTTYNNVMITPSTSPTFINGVPGYTWENLTYISSPTVLNGSMGAFLAPNPFAPQNFIQFSNTLGSNQIEIYFTDTTGWFCEYAELSIPILPMYIFSNLAEASWPNSAISSGFTTPSEFTMVLWPMTGGANLLYGSGPYIWTSGTIGASYTLLAYVKGQSYGGVIEDTSYWASPVRIADEAQDPITWTYTYGTNNIYVTFNYTNFDPPYGYDVTLDPTITPLWWTGAAWVAGPSVTATAQTFYVAPNSSAVSPTFQFAIPGTSDPLKSTWMEPEISWTTTIASSTPAGSSFVGEVIKGSRFLSNPDGSIASLMWLPGDINRDGSVNGLDLRVMASNWQETVPPGNPAADINQDGSINGLDLRIMAFYWQISVNPATEPAP